MPTGHAALMAPIVVSSSNDGVSIYYVTNRALSLTQGAYETMEELCDELQTQLQTVNGSITVTIQADDTSSYGSTITVSHPSQAFTILATDGWSQFGFRTPTSSATSHTSSHAVANTLVTPGIGIDNLGPVSNMGASSIGNDGTVNIQSNATGRNRTLKWTALTIEQCEIMRDIWDSCFDNGRVYYKSDWTGTVADNAFERMDKLTIDYKRNAALGFAARGSSNSGYFDFQCTFKRI